MESNQELRHWGIKGQKWGVRRFQNEDGSLTEEGKSRYMYAARHNKLDYKKLSDKDLDMINNRFNKENIYKRNVENAMANSPSTKAKKAAAKALVSAAKNSKAGVSFVAKLFGMPIKQAFEDAFKVESYKGGGKNKSDNDSELDNGYGNYMNNGHTWFKGYKPEGKDNMCITPNGQIKYLKQDKVDRGKEYISSATKNYGVSSSAGGRMGTYDTSGGSEAALRARYKASHSKEKPKQTSKPKKYDGPGSDDYYKSWSFHADHMQFIVTRDDSDSIMHHDIPGTR